MLIRLRYLSYVDQIKVPRGTLIIRHVFFSNGRSFEFTTTAPLKAQTSYVR